MKLDSPGTNQGTDILINKHVDPTQIHMHIHTQPIRDKRPMNYNHPFTHTSAHTLAL